MGINYAQVESDSWIHVQDPKKRKQIQDRLAQRARRKRIAESKRLLIIQEAQMQEIAEDAAAKEREMVDFEAQDETSQGFLSSSSNTTDTPSQSSSPASSGFTRDSRASMGADSRLLTRRVSNVHAALFNNGTILGLRCGIQVPVLSPPCTDKIPLPLHPTQLQMTVLHIPWIDRFPFPKMRDNAITHSCNGFDDEEFFCDIFTRESFEIKPESYSWDPTAWVMTNSFRDRWGFLFS
ncbi:hypothetical protein H2200_004012 [Cladophialophora chaetospira]|uniref:BZIP domain-containing protein n=1 Tax=Cladophialophora chaetospira TaxID=386627 RepID=A0AA38XFA6_9EURO|nr:hypothetical protein H2200_004012 [Cladophialophora chaetospira]